MKAWLEYPRSINLKYTGNIRQVLHLGCEALRLSNWAHRGKESASLRSNPFLLGMWLMLKNMLLWVWSHLQGRSYWSPSVYISAIEFSCTGLMPLESHSSWSSFGPLQPGHSSACAVGGCRGRQCSPRASMERTLTLRICLLWNICNLMPWCWEKRGNKSSLIRPTPNTQNEQVKGTNNGSLFTKQPIRVLLECRW